MTGAAAAVHSQVLALRMVEQSVSHRNGFARGGGLRARSLESPWIVDAGDGATAWVDVATDVLAPARPAVALL